MFYFHFQILTYKGYYDTNTLEFVGIEGIQIVATLSSSSTSGRLSRFSLSSRLTSLLRIASITIPSVQELNQIYHCLIQHVVKASIDPTSQPGITDHHRRLNVLASTMVHVWSQLEQTFRTSGFPHCSFSLRDLTRWVLGMMRYDLTPSDIFGNLWVSFGYEARRLFRDRMPGDENRLKFDKLFSGLLHGSSDGETEFGDWGTAQSKTLSDSALAVKFATGEPVAVNLKDEETETSFKKGQYWFVSWGSSDPTSNMENIKHLGNTLHLQSYATLHKLVSTSLKQIARDSYPKARELVVFPDFLDLVTRIDRVLSRPYGNLLLAGRCGMGRRSALRAVIQLHQFQVFTLHVGHIYTLRNFSNDLKAAFQSAGLDNLPTILILEEHHLVQDIILETINSVVSCGEAPGLISAEDIELLTSSGGTSLREAAAEAGYIGTLSGFFAKRVHANLHVIILLDIDDNESLFARLQANPSLYKDCEVSWLDKWSQGGQLLLPRLLVPNLPDSLQKEVFSLACLAIHQAAPHFRLASPRRFISLCTTYRQSYKDNREQLESQMARFSAGLTKLDEARQLVNKLKMNAAEQERQLREKQAEADKALSEISTAMEVWVVWHGKLLDHPR